MQQDSLRRQKYKKLTDCIVLSCENRAARHFLVLLLLLHFSLVGVEDRPLGPLISKKYTTFAHIAIPIPFAMSVIAQSSVVSRLRHMWSSGQLPHALLLTGPSGAGQMAVALDFARLLLCEKPEGSGEEARPCGTCPSCRMVERYAHPDLHFSFPVIRPKNASSTSQVVSDLWITEWRAMLTDGAYFDLDEWGQRMGIEKQQPCIYADESDELLRKVSIVSARGGYKVVIVWLPELMNVTCANKILKLLEEPPRQTVFLLCSDHPEQLLATIISRTQRVAFKPLTEAEIAEALMRERGLSAEDAARTAHRATGSYTRALRQLTVGHDEQEFLDMFVLLMRKCYLRDIKEMYAWAERMATWGRERQKSFLDYALQLVRENFVYNFHLPQLNYLSQSEEDFSRNFARFVNEANILGITAELTSARRDIAQNVNARMVFFDLALKMIVLLIPPKQ